MKFLTITKELKALSRPEKAKFLPKFFKTKPGEYGAGDKFIGVVVPDIRKVAKKYQNLPYPEVKSLLNSDIHEHRACALFILVTKFQRGDDEERKKAYTFYIKHMKCVNNWDLVDLSAHHIVGAMLWETRDFGVLEKWAMSKNLWQRRIAIVSTWYFIKKEYFQPTVRISEILIADTHDLIHKAVGWMLREVGKKNFAVVQNFVDLHGQVMPRTMLRYAIERFPEVLRLRYLKDTRVVSLLKGKLRG